MSLCLLRRRYFNLKTAKLIIIALSLALSVHVQPSECSFVNVCSSPKRYFLGARVNISSPGYPAANEIPSGGLKCSCHIKSNSTSNDPIQIMPVDIAYRGCSKYTSWRCDPSCWSSLQISSRTFCLSNVSKYFTIGLHSAVPSTSLINITYAVVKKVPSYNYTGKFAFSLYVPGARGLSINCNSTLSIAEGFDVTSSPNVVNSNAVFGSNEFTLSTISLANTTWDINNTVLPSPSQLSGSYSIFSVAVIVGTISILVVILIIASVIIILLRKSKKSSGQNSEENPLQPLAISDLEGEVQLSSDAVAPDAVAPDTVAGGAGTRVRPQVTLPPLRIITPTPPNPSQRREGDAEYDTPRHVCKRQSSNYTPMVVNSPISSTGSSSRVNKMSFSDNIYADLNQIAGQRGSDTRTSNDPVVGATDDYQVYYNSVPNAKRAPEKHSHPSYELCYSPGGDAGPQFQNSNVNGYEFYAALRDCGETVDLSNAESLYSNDQLYCNVGQKRTDNDISQRNEMILIENPSYVG